MTVLISCFFAYLGCGLFYQAKPRRSSLTNVVTSAAVRSGWFIAGCRVIATGLLLCSAYFASLPQGYERGITIWLGIVSACGFFGLFISAWNSEAHLPSLLISIVFLVVCLLLYFL